MLVELDCDHPYVLDGFASCLAALGKLEGLVAVYVVYLRAFGCSCFSCIWAAAYGLGAAILDDDLGVDHGGECGQEGRRGAHEMGKKTARLFAERCSDGLVFVLDGFLFQLEMKEI